MSYISSSHEHAVSDEQANEEVYFTVSVGEIRISTEDKHVLTMSHETWRELVAKIADSRRELT
jgi:hypothetical protein